MSTKRQTDKYPKLHLQGYDKKYYDHNFSIENNLTRL